jgi:hypothetical protein
MSEITLTRTQYEKLPYKGTSVTKGKTYGEIIGMMEDHGIKDYQWTKYQGTDQLAFPIKFVYRDMERSFIVKLTVPRLVYPLPLRKGRGAPTKITYLENESWRIFWWFLKSKLEAIEYGISNEFREFMPNIINKLADGSEVGLSDLILQNADRLDRLQQLEDKRGPRIIEAEVVDDPNKAS